MRIVNRIINKCGRLRNDVFFNLHTPNSFIKNTFQNTIIMYHGVDSKGHNPFNTRHTGVNVFYKQVKFLKEYCNIISLADFFEQKFLENKINVAITFDDGYLNNYLLARPILETMKVPATFFITGINNVNCDILWADYVNIVSKLYNQNITIDGEEYANTNGTYYTVSRKISIYDYIKNECADFDFKLKVMSTFDKVVSFKDNPTYFEYWKLMNDEQIRDTGKSKYIEIGSHGYCHNNLGTINYSDACDEITNSKKYLESLLQKEINSMGYPDGSYTREVINFAANAGYKYQLAAEGYLFDEDKTDSRILDRNGIYSCDSAANQLFNSMKK